MLLKARQILLIEVVSQEPELSFSTGLHSVEPSDRAGLHYDALALEGDGLVEAVRMSRGLSNLGRCFPSDKRV